MLLLNTEFYQCDYVNSHRITNKSVIDNEIYQLPLISSALLYVDLINVAYLMACAFIRL